MVGKVFYRPVLHLVSFLHACFASLASPNNTLLALVSSYRKYILVLRPTNSTFRNHRSGWRTKSQSTQTKPPVPHLSILVCLLSDSQHAHHALTTPIE
ncbi:hypothetical protein K474DRAFT_141992 [Panus rudis PR-1116 ss-1]|nr:hypothetical protein K474DRAFT_141992 [Panus rudis PR-1116 ss-1]